MDKCISRYLVYFFISIHLFDRNSFLQTVYTLIWVSASNDHKFPGKQSRCRLDCSCLIRICILYASFGHITLCRVPTGYGKHGKWLKQFPCMEKSWNLKINEKSWGSRGILAWDCFLDVNVAQIFLTGFTRLTILKTSGFFVLKRASQNHLLSYDVASESVIKPYIKNDNPLLD